MSARPVDAKEPRPAPEATPRKPAPSRRLRAASLWLGFLAFGGLAFIVGYAVAPRRPAAGPSPPGEAKEAPSDKRIRYWTCSMHPQIHQPQKGKCPICFMDLVPVYETPYGGEGEGARLVLSKAARELAEIETSPVEYRPLTVTVRMVGKVDYDETRLAYVSAWVPGRIDRLYVDYVGIRVSKGDHLTYVYSPDLRTAQEEFLIALRRWQAAKKGADTDEIASAQAIRDAGRKKLELWGILPAQIDELEKSGRADDHMTIYAPVGGTVIAREIFPGKYVQAGDRLFTIADLTAVWALLDAYEIDLGWLRYGQTVEFETDAYPGETFQGRIAFIQPVLNEMTRTVKVRVNVPNPGERLKPGMFVRARVDVTLDEAGRVKEPNLAGKWMCPMHPEVVKDKPAACDICGMALVEAAKLGFSHPEAPAKKVLSIPATAPLLTGTRAVVYIEERKDSEVSYAGRQIELGPRAGDYYVVRSGLREGERVVTRGNFKIDSALQIQARPSMMKPEGGEALPGHQHGGPAPQPPPKPSPAPAAPRAGVPDMQPALEAYLAMVDALAADDAAKAAAAIASLADALAKAEGKGLTGHAQHLFHDLVGALRKAVPGEAPKDLASQRRLLGTLAKPLADYLQSFGHGFSTSLFEVFCPMAFDKQGAGWVQRGRDIRNPYFGAQMPQCGEVRREIAPGAAGGTR